METIIIKSPLGAIGIVADEKGVTEIYFTKKPITSSHKVINIHLKNAARELAGYFEGRLTKFTFSKNPTGTPFQKKVWAVMEKIPYGKCVSYSHVAHDIENPKAVRAVGTACKRNPLGIVTPCHRVIGKSGKLTGYAGGLDIKKWLLNHETESR